MYYNEVNDPQLFTSFTVCMEWLGPSKYKGASEYFLIPAIAGRINYVYAMWYSYAGVLESCDVNAVVVSIFEEDDGKLNKMDSPYGG